jgi:hypothetical protein
MGYQCDKNKTIHNKYLHIYRRTAVRSKLKREHVDVGQVYYRVKTTRTKNSLRM